MSNIHDQIELERQQAREVCNLEGANSEGCAAAWDAVEELQAEAAHQKQNTKEQTSLEQYCSNNPDADECRVYED
jgi:hypothetical protein